MYATIPAVTVLEKPADYPLDPSVLEGYHFLRAVTGRDLLADFIDELLSDLPVQLQSLALAVGRGDSPRIVTSAAGLRRSANAMGARGLAALARQLEAAGRRGAVSHATRLYPHVEEAADRARFALQGMRG